MRFFVVPTEDSHWEYREHEVDDDDVQLAGGYALAYMNRRDSKAVYLQYEERMDGGWYGFIQSTIVDPEYPTEVWQMAYGLAEELPEPELTEHYDEAVSVLSDSEFLSHLCAYESGAHDFIGSLEDEIVPRLNEELGIWSGVIPVSTAEEARRYLEMTLVMLAPVY
jgi:hypothetical protein